jgi:dTDP-4-amino-4,6-dideoxygalactose transaminase
MPIPLTRPNPARLSEATVRLREIEERAIFSNFGPLTAAFEQNITEQLFSGVGSCLTVCNATIGLMLAIRQTIESRPKSRRRYALMPSFTFAAAAQAAQWNRLTPLFCDINRDDWSADAASELRLIQKYRDQIAVIVPYATFGYDIDLNWYEEIQRRFNIPVVVDAAASLGTIAKPSAAPAISSPTRPLSGTTSRPPPAPSSPATASAKSAPPSSKPPNSSPAA